VYEQEGIVIKNQQETQLSLGKSAITARHPLLWRVLELSLTTNRLLCTRALWACAITIIDALTWLYMLSLEAPPTDQSAVTTRQMRRSYAYNTSSVYKM